jgi:hypothetical protein
MVIPPNRSRHGIHNPVPELARIFDLDHYDAYVLTCYVAVSDDTWTTDYVIHAFPSGGPCQTSEGSAASSVTLAGLSKVFDARPDLNKRSRPRLIL